MADEHIIFPTGSPVDVLGGERIPAPMPRSNTSAQLLRKLSPLIQAREETGKVYSDKSYFERAYPDADKKLKRMLHQRVMSAWANALNDDVDEDDTPGLGGSGVTINICIGR